MHSLYLRESFGYKSSLSLLDAPFSCMLHFVDGNLLILVLYVNDLIFTGDEQLICFCKDDLAREFKMKDIGLMHYFLGREVW